MEQQEKARLRLCVPTVAVVCLCVCRDSEAELQVPSTGRTFQTLRRSEEGGFLLNSSDPPGPMDKLGHPPSSMRGL
ncbi:unnamed protein product [Menidia menidia]|uniref:(Atlantic silverside) hypothetical protein n=1 Tax=Menidia menidia TaxID=238744 RepID=A0A8S4BR71_9TELE|nr:unnamed protein product [Menidia menidia]